MARRDRVPLTTPIPQPALKGWKIDRFVKIDMEQKLLSGSISFYDTSGVFIRSLAFSDFPYGHGIGDVVLTDPQIDTVAALIVSSLQARDAALLAGTRVVETVTSGTDTVSNP